MELSTGYHFFDNWQYAIGFSKKYWLTDYTDTNNY